MPRAQKGQRFGGRVAGTPNRLTIEKQLRAAQELAKQAGHSAKPLAKEVLEDFMHLTAGMAAFYQPTAPGQPVNANQNEEKFWQAALACKEFAKALAPYQSPTFRAITTVPAPSMPSGGPKQIEGKVVDLNDAAALTRVFRQRIAPVRG